ncbi:MAG: diguanylate cyclase [Gammaproteobacteria bacterium]|nr:diguanylate cyclase [Gammaproteobacteria bacterium]
MKLLIADADLTSRIALEAITRRWGYEPVVVEDGAAAWQVMREEEPPQLLLLDWTMPAPGGLVLCQKIRQQCQGKQPFIILLMARKESADIVSGLEAGANDHIVKPFEMAELQARLQVGRRTLDLQAQSNAAAQALIYQASHDDMTGLMNRRAVMDALERERADAQCESQVLCIGMCDIDHFKRINDGYGDLTGDAVLQGVARRIEGALRPYDHVGRYGGEAFLVVLNANELQAKVVFERICHAVASMPIVVRQTELNVTVSCGVSFFRPPQDDRESAELLVAADGALCEAKEGGRNRTIFRSTQKDVTHHE